MHVHFETPWRQTISSSVLYFNIHAQINNNVIQQFYCTCVVIPSGYINGFFLLGTLCLHLEPCKEQLSALP